MKTKVVVEQYFELEKSLNKTIEEIEEKGGYVVDIKMTPEGRYQDSVIAVIMYNECIIKQSKRVSYADLGVDEDKAKYSVTSVPSQPFYFNDTVQILS